MGAVCCGVNVDGLLIMTIGMLLVDGGSSVTACAIESGVWVDEVLCRHGPTSSDEELDTDLVLDNDDSGLCV